MEKNGECSYTMATHTLILVCIRRWGRELCVAGDGAAIGAPVSELWRTEGGVWVWFVRELREMIVVCVYFVVVGERVLFCLGLGEWVLGPCDQPYSLDPVGSTQ
ncbi:hypothetical protein PIB30_055620 [Stylosanthes scabra]|uniref:Transmembrane protein n=1 Tax=Stylosanthes scabra TaxID=79078 RepID=A0ABU6ZHW1_9FABA|nr:hypothetical protein [Stylosanthes scabra]